MGSVGDDRDADLLAHPAMARLPARRPGDHPCTEPDGPMWGLLAEELFGSGPAKGWWL